jgi:hypothetical protein
VAVCTTAVAGDLADETLQYHRNVVRSTIRSMDMDVDMDMEKEKPLGTDDVNITDPTPTIHVEHVVGQYVHPYRYFFMYWVYEGANVHFFIASPFDAWIAVGFALHNTMPGADIAAGSLNQMQGEDGNTFYKAVMADRHAVDHNMPVLDTQQDIVLLQGYYEKRWTVMEFRRAVDTQDAENDVRLDKAAFVLWAVGPPGSVIEEEGFGDFFKHERRGFVKVHFPTGMAVHVEDLSREEAHASLMMYAWGFFAVVAIFTSRYMKEPFGSWWFAVHASLAAMVAVLTISAFIVIVTYVAHKRDSHFNSPHKILGLTIVTALVVQMWLGLFSKIKFDPEREHTPLVPDKVHWWLGRFIVIASFVNILTGLLLFPKTGLAPWILIGVWVVCIIAFVAMFELYFRGDMPSRTTVAKEYQLLERGIQIVQQNNSALLFCFLSMMMLGIICVTLAVSLLKK